MNGSVVRRLIAKDLYLYRWLIAGALAAGLGSLALAAAGPGDGVESGPNLGILLFITTVVAFGIFVAMLGALKERQEKSQLFVLSLPLSPAQYARAKVAAALIAYLGPWTVLTAGTVAAILATPSPDGGIPPFVAMMGFFLANFCLLLALVVITLSELVAVAGILLTNILVTVYFVYVARLPGLAGGSGDATATWSPTILALLGLELAWIALCLGLALYLPSRKKDFL